ncbi:MAG TPA: GAF domain-containing protein [Burkholderiaceae bacterium]|nr:GAF domain-containing protein [Burkholderiaceae bacterium]
MKRRSKVSDAGTKARRPRAAKLNRRNPPKAALPSESTPSREEAEAARLNYERDEALEWQSATSDILRAITAAPGDADGTLRKIATTTARLFGAAGASFRIAEGNEFKWSVGVGQGAEQIATHLDPTMRQIVGGRNLPSTVVSENLQIHVPNLDDVDADKADWPGLKVARANGIRTMVGTPLRSQGRAIGALLVFRNVLRPFDPVELQLLQTFADQAVIAIENTRLLNELRQRTIDLTEALEQQTATSEVLQVIASSPGDLQPVFASVLEKGVRVCSASFGILSRWDGDGFRLLAAHNVPPAYLEYRARAHLRPDPKNPGPLSRAAATKTVVHVTDCLSDQAYIDRNPAVVASVELAGMRTVLVVPLLKEGLLIGAFALYRQEVRPFTDKQIALITNFANQAVIAIENTRLLNELREKTDQLAAQSQDLAKLNRELEQRVADQVGEIERMGRLRRFLPPQVADLIVASGAEKQLESHRREITALFCDLRGFTGFSESADPEDVMALLRDYHAAIGEIIIKYSGTLERYAGDGVMVVFNDPVPVEKPALQAVLMALEMRDVIGALTEKWRRLGHDIGFGIGIAHGFATLGTIGFEGRFDYAAIGTVSNVASRLCDEAKPSQILISPRVLMAVEDAVTVESIGEFALKGIRRPLAAYNVLAPKAAN